MHGGLLVTDEDVTDRVLVEDRVVDRQHGTAGIAEYDLYALVLEGLEQDLGAGTAGMTMVRHGAVLSGQGGRVNRGDA